jgi:hypothetical protein
MNNWWRAAVDVRLRPRGYWDRQCNINPLTPEFNPSAQRFLTICLLGILLLEPCISLIYAWKTNKYNNYSFNLLIMYGISYTFRHYTAIITAYSYCFLRDAQLRSSRQNIVDGRVVSSGVELGDLRSLRTTPLETTRPSTIFYRLLINWASLRRHLESSLRLAM